MGLGIFLIYGTCSRRNISLARQIGGVIQTAAMACIGDAEPVSYTHLDVYKRQAPISNPGRAALAAVLAPDTTPYLYFVSRNDGTHQFSVTLEEHQAAVNKYQRASH